MDQHNPGVNHHDAKRQLQVSIAGHLLTLIIVIGSVLAFIRSYDHSVNEASNAAGTANKNVVELAELVKRMDEHGTSYSHTQIPLEQSMITAMQNQVITNSKSITDLAPRVERMLTQMEYIQAWVQEQKAEKDYNKRRN